MSAAVVHPRLARASFERAIRPLLIGREKFEQIGFMLLDFSFPFLDVELRWHARGTSVRLRVDGSEFSYLPVSGWWIDETGAKLLPGRSLVPAGNGFHTADQDGRPACWFCFLGWREYHDHTSHQNVSWASIRRDPRYSPLQLIAQLHKDLNSASTGVA
jgi:hypothetical protein